MVLPQSFGQLVDMHFDIITATSVSDATLHGIACDLDEAEYVTEYEHSGHSGIGQIGHDFNAYSIALYRQGERSFLVLDGWVGREPDGIGRPFARGWTLLDVAGAQALEDAICEARMAAQQAVFG